MFAKVNSLSQSKQDKLNALFQSRLNIALLALTLQVLIIIPLLRSFLFVVAVFNLPAVIALISCIFHKNTLNYQIQRNTKFLLKIGVAKAVGGVLLALFAGLKYYSVLNNANSNMKAVMELCVIYLGGSAFVDILYSLFAFMAIKRTKNIIKILRNKKSRSSHANTYIMRSSSSSSEGSSSDTASCSEEDSCEKGSQNSV